MSLTCQNCGSTDIVTIQGQNFCINCGQMVKESRSPSPQAVVAPVKTEAATKKAEDTAAVAVKAKKVAKVVKAAKAPKKIKHTDEPAVPAIITHLAPTEFETEKLKTITQKAPVVAASAPTQIESPEPKYVPHIVNAPKVKSQQHGKSPDSHKLKQSSPPEQKDGGTYLKAAAPITALERRRVREEAEFEDIKPHPLSFTVRIASYIAIPVGALTALLIAFNVNQDIAWYCVFAMVVLVAVSSLMAQAALLYGLSRNQDGRPTQRERWWAAARSGFLEVINVDLMALITLSIAAIGWVSLWKLDDALPDQVIVRYGVVGLGNLLAAWVTLGALSSRHIAIPAVVIGGISSPRAIKLGWQAYIKAGGHLVLALTEALVARLTMTVGLIALTVLIAHYAKDWNTLSVAILSGVGVAAAVICWFALLLQVEVRVWLKQYRYWVNVYFPEQKLRLLSGRTHSAGRR